MTRTTTLAALLVCAAVPATSAQAQYRPTGPVSDLTGGTLAQLVSSQQNAVSSCAASEETGAYVAEVSARVAPGAAPSTMFNARISVQVRSRPRDGELESCIRRRVRDGLRHQPYAVAGRAIRARRTFRIADRPQAPPPRPAPAYSESAVHATIARSHRTLQRCVEVVGVPEQVTLRVAVEADGRLTLTNANLPSGASPHALSCLARAFSRMRVAARPGRRVQVVHRMGLRR